MKCARGGTQEALAPAHEIRPLTCFCEKQEVSFTAAATETFPFAFFFSLPSEEKAGSIEC